MIYDLSKELEKAKYKERVNHLYTKGANVELKQVKLRRSITQNSYLHVCITLFSIEYGSSIYEMKQELKNWYGFYTDKGGVIIYGETSKMNSEELTTFIEWIRNKAVKDLGLYIPTSEEYIENQSEINRIIYNNKKYK